MLGAEVEFVERKLDAARDLLASATVTTGADNELGWHYTSAVFAMQAALCYCEAGRPHLAVQLYNSELSADAFSRRDYGYFMSLKGSALAAMGEPDEASNTGLVALVIATATSSERTVRELINLLRRLTPWSNRPSVQGLQEAILA
jgi:hypothetical protein